MDVSVEWWRRYADWYWLKLGDDVMWDCMRAGKSRSRIFEMKSRLEMVRCDCGLGGRVVLQLQYRCGRGGWTRWVGRQPAVLARSGTRTYFELLLNKPGKS